MEPFFDIEPSIILLDLSVSEANLQIFRSDVDVDSAGLSYKPPRLHARLHPVELSCRLVKAALRPLLVNLMLLSNSDHPELVRHMRMSWRRFVGALKLSRTLCELDEPPDLSSLQFLMHQLGHLRDMDVARLDVLDRIKTQFILKYQSEGLAFSELMKSLDMAAHFQRQIIRECLLDNSIQETAWALTLWTIAICTDKKTKPRISNHPICLSDWAMAQVGVLHNKFERSKALRRNVPNRHRIRICAKRLYYAIEDLEGLLHPPPHQWLKKAIQVQRKGGEYRDLQVTVELAERYGSWSLAHQFRKLVKSGQVLHWINQPADPGS